MGILQTLGLAREAVPDATAENTQLAAARMQLELVTERLVDLQKEDRGWELMSRSFQNEIDREGLGRNADLVRMMSIMNPLMKRGKLIRSEYVFGQGVTINARSTGEDAAQDIDAVVQKYLDDEGNRVSVFGEQARTAIENDLFDDGNVFVAHFTNPLDGRVKVRPIPFNQIVEVITDPDDVFTPWYYKRQWTEKLPTETFGADGLSRQRTAYYPDLRFQPLTKLRSIDGHPVIWDAPIYHIKVNPVGRERVWGIGDGFAAMPWARGYKEFLEDWALLMKAVARIAWIIKDKNGKSNQLRAAAQGMSQGAAGGVAFMGGTTELEAPPASGATLDAESSRPLAAMVAAALGVTVTILTADPGQTGARAVAETLDRPMRHSIETRQAVHAQFIKASTSYAIEQSALAPRGELKGKPERDGDRLLAILDGDVDESVEVHFPPLDEIDVKTIVDAIVAADGTGKMPPLETLKMLLRAFKLDDIEEILEEVTDDDGKYIPPELPVDAAAGNAAAAALRQGEDPAKVL